MNHPWKFTDPLQQAAYDAHMAYVYAIENHYDEFDDGKTPLEASAKYHLAVENRNIAYAAAGIFDAHIDVHINNCW